MLSEPVDYSHALSPTNDSEQMQFRLLHPTLVRLDCEGRLRPGLATSWSRSSEPNAWVFVVGNRVRLAPAVLGSSGQMAAVLQSSGRELGIDSAVELDQKRIWVRLRPGIDSLPRVLADPKLGLPAGPATAGEATRAGDVIPSYGGPMVSFQMAENGDPRDAIDRGVDLAITRDPSVVSYVRDRPDLEAYPLPWNRTYVMLQPPAAVPIELGGLDSLRRSLARDAIRSDARAALLPSWADSLTSCGDNASPPEPPTSSRVVYQRYDPAARGLAERIVALSRDPKLTAAPLDTEEFDRALRAGSERAYIVAVPRRTLSPCRRTTNWPIHARVTPLVDTRAYAIVRRGSPPLTVEWDGTVVPEDSL